MLSHECRGAGPAVVFIAGLGGLGKFWTPVMDRLQDAFTVVTLDHPGSGASARRGPQTIPDLADAVLELTDALGIDRFSVVGHSTGGLVAQTLALDHAPRLDRLVLSSTWAAADRRFRDLFEIRRRILLDAGLGLYKAHGALLAYPPHLYDRYATPLPAPGHAPDDAAEIQVTAERIDMLVSYSRADDLHRIATPTLVLGAMDDQIVPFHHAEHLAQAIPHSELTALSGGHFPPTTQTEVYTSRLRAFLEAPAPAASSIPSLRSRSC
jgi:aminoacrylate hydrolase